MWKSEESLGNLYLTFHLVEFRVKEEVVRFASGPLTSLGHLVGPTFDFENIKLNLI